MEGEPSHIYYVYGMFLNYVTTQKREILLYVLSEGRTHLNSHKNPPMWPLHLTDVLETQVLYQQELFSVLELSSASYRASTLWFLIIFF